MLNEILKRTCEQLISDAEQTISEERKVILNDLANSLKKEIALKKQNGDSVAVVYLCTHNSRRSHFAQVWGHIASAYLKVTNLKTYSGGTVATACHPNTIAALKQIGFDIKCDDLSCENPMYHVHYNNEDYIECYSKANTDESLPQKDFMAVMTCSDSDVNCPLVPGAKQRFSTTYDDPKEFDETQNPLPHYIERSLQIATEILYTFQQVTRKN